MYLLDVQASGAHPTFEHIKIILRLNIIITLDKNKLSESRHRLSLTEHDNSIKVDMIVMFTCSPPLPKSTPREPLGRKQNSEVTLPSS